MYAHPHRHPTRPPATAHHAAGRLRRLAGVIAAVSCGLLVSAGIVPAAFAMNAPGGGQGVPPHSSVVTVISAGGMPGWQIALIALGAALVAAVAALFLDRALHARRAGSATTA